MCRTVLLCPFLDSKILLFRSSKIYKAENHRKSIQGYSATPESHSENIKSKLQKGTEFPSHTTFILTKDTQMNSTNTDKQICVCTHTNKIKNTHWNNQIAVGTSGPSEYSATQFIKQWQSKLSHQKVNDI